MNKWTIKKDGQVVKRTAYKEKVKAYLSIHGLASSNSGIFYPIEGVEVIPPALPNNHGDVVSMCFGGSHI